MLEDWQIKQQRMWLNTHTFKKDLLCTLQLSKQTWLIAFFFIYNFNIDVIQWLILFCNVFWKVIWTESQFPMCSVDGELFVSHCAKLLTLGKKETLLETFVFRHAFRKMPLASLAARNLSCRHKPNNYISNFSAFFFFLPRCCYATMPYALTPQGSRQVNRKMEENLTSISYLWGMDKQMGNWPKPCFKSVLLLFGR